MVKNGTAGFSIGFMSESRPRQGDGRELILIDQLEVSVTSRPVHPATRTLSWKSTERGADDILGADFWRFPPEPIEVKADELETKAAREPVQIATFEVG